MYYFILLLFIIQTLVCHSASIYDATLSVDTSSRCQIVTPDLAFSKPNSTSFCGCSDSTTSTLSPPIQDSVKEEKCPQSEQPLRLLTMVSRIPLPSSQNCVHSESNQQSESLCQNISNANIEVESCEKDSSLLPSLSSAKSCPSPTSTQEIPPISTVSSCCCTTTASAKGRVFLRRGQTGKIITKANHIAPIERVSIVYDVATLAVPTTFTVVRTDYVPLTQTKTHVQTFAWTTFAVDAAEGGCPVIASSLVIKPTTTPLACSSISVRSISSSFVKDCQIATLCRKKKSKAAQATTTLPEVFDNDNFNVI